MRLRAIEYSATQNEALKHQTTRIVNETQGRRTSARPLTKQKYSYMKSEIAYIVNNINNLSLQERYDVRKLIYVYQADIFKQRNNGAYALYNELESETIF